MYISDFLSSWLSSSTGSIILHPLDTLRVRYQTRGHHPLQVVRTEPFKMLYAGILMPLSVGAPLNALVFMTNEAGKEAIYFALARRSKEQLEQHEQEQQALMLESPQTALSSSSEAGPSPPAAAPAAAPHFCPTHGPRLPLWGVAAAGAFAGGVCCILQCPVTIIRIQQQVRAAPTAGERLAHTSHGFVSPLSVAKGLYQAEGVRGLYRSFHLEVLSNALGRGLYFGLYEANKRLLAPLYRAASAKEGRGEADTPEEQRAAEHALAVRVGAAAVTSVASWLVIFPIDLVKNKIQSDGVGPGAERLFGDGTWRQCARITYRSGGVRGFFRGYSLTAIRGTLMAAINLPLYDALRPGMRARMHAPPYIPGEK